MNSFDTSNKSKSARRKGKKSLIVLSSSIVDDRELNSARTENGRGELIEPENSLVSASKTRGEKLSTRVPKKIVKAKPGSIRHKLRYRT